MDAFSLGQLLRDAREAKELTLEQAEQTLRIRRPILEALEAGQFDQLEASPVQLRGFMRNYARYVGQDEERILQYYEAVLQGASRNGRMAARRQQRERERAERRRAAEADTGNATYAGRPVSEARRPATLADRRAPSPAARLLRGVLLLIIGAGAVGVIAFVTAEVLRRPSATGAEGTQVETGVGLLPPTLTATPRPTITPLPDATALPQAVQNYAGEPVFVTMEFRQRVWLRVVVDGVEQFAGLVRPGEAILEYRATNEVAVSASNAGALVVTYNGQPQPSFGARGQGAEIVFRPGDSVTVSTGPGFEPTITPTPGPAFEVPPTETPASAEPTDGSPALTPEPVASVTTEASPADGPSLTPPPTGLPIIGATSTSAEATTSPVATATPGDGEPAATSTEASPGADGGLLPPRMTPTNIAPPKTG